MTCERVPDSLIFGDVFLREVRCASGVDQAVAQNLLDGPCFSPLLARGEVPTSSVVKLSEAHSRVEMFLMSLLIP